MRNPPEAKSDDAALARRIQAGEHSAFEILVRRHSQTAFRLAWRQLGSREEAEDLVQTIFLRYWKNPQSWNPDGGSRFSTWLYRVVLNGSTDLLRKRRISEPVEDDSQLPDERMNQVSQIASHQEQQQVVEALHRLPERQRQAVTLVYYEQLSVKEAAIIMDASPKAVESLLGRARSALKNDLCLRELIEEVS